MRKAIKFYADEMLTAREVLTRDEFGDLQVRLWDYILYGKDDPPEDRTLLALYKNYSRKEDLKEAAYDRKVKYRESHQKDREEAASEAIARIKANLTKN